MSLRLILAMALTVAGCDNGSMWNGWVYPDRNALVDDIPIGAYESLEECRKSARYILERLNTHRDGEKVEGDYECGLNCRADENLGGLNVCEKTER